QRTDDLRSREGRAPLPLPVHPAAQRDGAVVPDQPARRRRRRRLRHPLDDRSLPGHHPPIGTEAPHSGPLPVEAGRSEGAVVTGARDGLCSRRQRAPPEPAMIGTREGRAMLTTRLREHIPGIVPLMLALAVGAALRLQLALLAPPFLVANDSADYFS